MDKWTNGQMDKETKDRGINGPMEIKKKNIAFSESPPVMYRLENIFWVKKNFFFLPKII